MERNLVLGDDEWTVKKNMRNVADG